MWGSAMGAQDSIAYAIGTRYRSAGVHMAGQLSTVCAGQPFAFTAARRSASSRCMERLVSSEAAMTPMVTMPIMMVEMALISGFTPSRTSE